MAGRLSIVATPIGNLEDITLRALRILREADLILAEDTRHTRKLCSHHGIDTKLRAFHAHSSPHAVEQCLADLIDGKHLALVSDAGTPLISDPGSALAQAARAAGVTMEAIPGPSAVATALCVSGVPFDSYRFMGFLPRSGGKRRRALAQIAAAEEACVLFESPKRVQSTLLDLASVLDDSRCVAVCRELTKLHEEVMTASAAALAERLQDHNVRGEITVVIEGAKAGAASVAAPQDLDEQIKVALARGASPRDLVRELAVLHDLPKRELYARVLALVEKT